MSLHHLFAGILSAHTGAGYAEGDEPESSLDDDAQYAIKVLERRIDSLTIAQKNCVSAVYKDSFLAWHNEGTVTGLQIAIDALKDEIRFVKLERGPLYSTKG